MLYGVVLLGALFSALPQSAPDPASEPQAAGAAAGSRFALLVGVSDYSNFPSLSLGGPANDVILMRELLKCRLDFDEKDIVTLSEAEGQKDKRRYPERAAIDRELSALADKVKGKPDARVVVYLSGHGTQQPDVLRPPAEVKPNGMIEVFLPRDFGRWNGREKRLENSLLDFELREHLARIRDSGARVWVIADCCYSGWIARGLVVPRKVDLRDPRLGLAPPPEIYEEAARRGQAKEKATPTPSPLDKPGLVAVYASLPNETTFEDYFPWDLKDPNEIAQKHGVLTWHLYTVLNDVVAGQDMTFRELVRRIQAKYHRLGIDQPTPLVDGRDADRGVFWETAGQSGAAFSITKRSNDALVVNAGLLHGLSTSSVLAVYPAGGKMSPEKILGHVVVTQAGTRASKVASWDEGKAPEDQRGQFKAPSKPLDGGEQCEVVLLAYGDLKLRLAVATTDGKNQPIDQAGRVEVRRALGELTPRAKQFITVVPDGEPAGWLARPGDADTLELVRREGMVGGPLRVQKSPRDLSTRLMNIAHSQMLIRFETGDVPPDKKDVEAKTAISFDYQLLRQEQGIGEFKLVSLVSGDGPVFRPGDRLQWKFTNTGGRNADITVLQIDQNYDIFEMFPVPQTDGPDPPREANESDRLFAPTKEAPNPQPQFTVPPPVKEDGVTSEKDINGEQRGLHAFVIIAVEGEGGFTDFGKLWRDQRAVDERGDRPGVRRARPFLDSIKGRGNTRQGLDMTTKGDYVVRVIPWQIVKPVTSH
jgi:hypothetical protein